MPLHSKPEQLLQCVTEHNASSYLHQCLIEWLAISEENSVRRASQSIGYTESELLKCADPQSPITLPVPKVRSLANIVDTLDILLMMTFLELDASYSNDEKQALIERISSASQSTSDGIIRPENQHLFERLAVTAIEDQWVTKHSIKHKTLQ